MSKVIDIKSKKVIKPIESIAYLDRIKLCEEISKTTIDNKCNCVYCIHKEILANKLVTISQWLVTDYSQKTDIELYWADWFDIIVTSADKVKNVVYPNLKD